MKTKLLTLLTAALLFSGCQPDGESGSYSRERTAISSVNIDLKQDIKDGRVCAWTSAHSPQEKFLALVNYLRAQPIHCGDIIGPIGCLAWSGSLADAAQEHSDDMALSGKLSDIGSGSNSDITAYSLGLNSGSTPEQRAKYHGFKGNSVMENILKETIASDSVTDDDIINAVEKIVNSKGCTIIMNKSMNAFGMAQTTKTLQGKSYSYWTQLFGAN